MIAVNLALRASSSRLSAVRMLYSFARIEYNPGEASASRPGWRLRPGRLTPHGRSCVMLPLGAGVPRSFERGEAEMPKLKFFVSDLHLSVRTGSDDFDRNKEKRFEHLLDIIHEEARGACAEARDCELIILGDFVDLLEAEPVLGPQVKKRLPALVDAVAEKHEVAFKALRRFLRRGHKLFFVVGNHDRGLCYSDALDAHLLPRRGPRGDYHPANFMRASHYFSAALGIYAEHGHLADSVNRPADGVGDRVVRTLVRPMEDEEWDDCLAEKATAGELDFLVNLPKHLEDVGVLRLADNLKPTVSLIRYLWRLKDGGILSPEGLRRFANAAAAVAGFDPLVEDLLGAHLGYLVSRGWANRQLTRFVSWRSAHSRVYRARAEEMQRRMSHLWGMQAHTVVMGHTHAYDTGAQLDSGGMLYNVGAWRDTFFLQPDDTFRWYPSRGCHYGVARGDHRLHLEWVGPEGKTVEMTERPGMVGGRGILL